MVTKADCIRMIESHIDGLISLEDLAAWAVEHEHEGSVDPVHAELIAEVLSALRETGDPHRFRWEEPDLDDLLQRLRV